MSLQNVTDVEIVVSRKGNILLHVSGGIDYGGISCPFIAHNVGGDREPRNEALM